MRLVDLPTNTSFNTSTSELVTTFYEPALKAASTYDRGVGYFTSNWLRMAATGLAAFAGRGGIARFIVSPHMSAEDWAACRQGVAGKADAILIEKLREVAEDLPRSLETRTLSTLSWMIADGLMDIRIAMPVGRLDGDFHDKFGIFGDIEGPKIAFHGSPNDSAKAFQNYEAISVFYSWVDEREAERVAGHQSRFDRLWKSKDPNVRVFDLPQAIRKNFVQFTTTISRPYSAPRTRASEVSNKWRHQAAAVEVFLEKEHGVLEMATGTGKTQTALYVLSELLKREAITTVVIAMTGTDLLTQWYKALIRAVDLSLYRHYEKFKEASDFLSAPRDKVLIVSRQYLGSVLTVLPEREWARTLIICDEVHGLGSPSMVRDLSGIIQRHRFRLGLSATPEREYDQQGNEFIEKEIGPVIFEFTIEDAIRRAILCEFDYTALDYQLTDEDRAAIRQAFARHHARKTSGESASEEILYREIAFVRKTTLSKIKPFSAHLKDHPDLYRRCLIFVETAAFGQAVQSVLVKARIDYHTYYQAEDREVLDRFARGDLDCLISCHRLSEGIDIQSVQNVVLFSSARSELETTQRLGRCLRIDPTNLTKRSHVLDFVDLEDTKSDGKGYDTDVVRHRRLSHLSQVRHGESGETLL